MTARYVRDAACEAFPVDDAWLVVHTEGFTVTTLNGAGGRCWELLERPRTAAELAEAVAAGCGMPPEEAVPDVDVFLRELAACGLIRDVR